jgi:uncharacterized protein (TIGR03437 family)
MEGLRPQMTMTRFSCTTVLLVLVFARLLSAAPSITRVANAASNIMPGLPNSGIAPGAIFVVYGTGMGPSNISIAQAAFQTTSLSNTSVAVTAGGTTVNAPLYYTSDKQVAALLPSSTPTGSATITVTYNSQASAPMQIGVVSNNLGLFTVDTSGTGSGIVTYPDYSLVSPLKAAKCGGPYTTCGAANPGDTLILWGTGLGRVNGDDASGAGLGQNMPNIPLKVWIGGIQAKVIYQGRSGCCIGEDQIVFVVPDDVPTGCAVPVSVEITPNITQISNNVLMAVAKGARDCTSTDLTLTPETLAKFQQLVNGGTIVIGYIELDHFANDNAPGFHDQMRFFFGKATGKTSSPLFALTDIDRPPTGTCIAGGGGGANILDFQGAVDGGSTVTVKGPAGSMPVTITNPGDRAPLSAAGTFLVPGDYTVSGSGGKDVGPFSATINVPVAPTLTSPTSASGLTITRSKGMTVTWNPNGSTGRMELILESYFNSGAGVVYCRAPASAGTFTIPPSMLLMLPAGNSTDFRFQLGDQGPATSGTFTAPGMDFGLIQTFVDGVSLFNFTIN